MSLFLYTNIVLISYINSEHIVNRVMNIWNGILDNSFWIICLINYRRYLHVNCGGLCFYYYRSYSGRMNYGDLNYYSWDNLSKISLLLVPSCDSLIDYDDLSLSLLNIVDRLLLICSLLSLLF